DCARTVPVMPPFVAERPPGRRWLMVAWSRHDAAVSRLAHARPRDPHHAACRRAARPRRRLPCMDAQRPDRRHGLVARPRGEDVPLWFYPKAMTPGCTTEGDGLRDSFAAFQERRVEIFGVSFDPPAQNKAFVEAERFPF